MGWVTFEMTKALLLVMVCIFGAFKVLLSCQKLQLLIALSIVDFMAFLRHVLSTIEIMVCRFYAHFLFLLH